MRLSELKTGEKGVITKVLGHGGFRKRIVEMGFIKGKTVEVVLNAPLKDPIKYRILGYEVSLRQQEAALIEVVSEEEAKENLQQQTRVEGIAEEIPVSDLTAIAQGRSNTINVALVGNPNCGKTSLFNIASGAHERVGNYSGVTVDAKEGMFKFKDYTIRLIDLPGTYSLSAYSPEEIYVRQYIIDKTPDVIINVVDSSNLERNLYLTTQLIDMDIRMVVALNMYDELEESGSKLDYLSLSKLLGVPMVPTVCRKQMGIGQLFDQVINVYENADAVNSYLALQMQPVKQQIIEHVHRHEKLFSPFRMERQERVDRHIEKDETAKKEELKAKLQERMNTPTIRHIHINHGQELETAIKQVQTEICKNESIRARYSTRFLAIKLLENDKEFEKTILRLPNGKEILDVRNREAERIRKLVNEDTESAITDAKYGFVEGALKETLRNGPRKTGRVTRAIDSMVTHKVWGFPIFFLLLYLIFDTTFVWGAYPQDWLQALVDLLGGFLNAHMADGSLKDLLVDGIVGGVGSVIVFLPNILILYFFISILEDSGYMARAAFIMDKIMHKMGLHGKSFIPLIMGFGCNVPAVMASRTIESHKSRLITMLINPLMSCSARLPIYLVITAALFPHHAGVVLFGLYATGIALAVVMARIFNKVLVRGDDTPFVMELPPYRMPTAKAIFRHTWEKGKQYLKKMGGIIMIASIIIWFLGYYPNHDSYDNVAEQQENSYIGKIGKAIEPVLEPLGFDWKMSVGLLSGAGAKELVVSTLGVLYAGEGSDDESFNLSDHLPIAPLAGMSYMLFVLIYFPCIATLAAIKQESGKWKWALFAACYTTALAWVVSFVVYQVGRLLGL